MRKITWGRILAIFLTLIMMSQCLIIATFADEPDELPTTDRPYATGLIPEIPEEMGATYVPPPSFSAYAALPTSVDLSVDPYFPNIGDQGAYGACASYATTYYQFTYAAARLNNWNVKGTNSDKVASPKWTYNFLNKGVDSGSSLSGNIDILKQAGSVKFNEFYFSPLSSKNVIQYREWFDNVNAAKNALNTRVSVYNYSRFANRNAATPITSPNSVALNQMKTLLSEGHVLTFDTDIYGWYIPQTSNPKVAIRAINSDSAHAMCIVGYNDTFSYDLNGNGSIQDFEKGAFKIANSWGTSWQNNGYIWLMYDALNRESLATNQNVTGRIGAIGVNRFFGTIVNENDFHWIDVENCTPKLTVEVKLNSARRDDIICSIGYYTGNGENDYKTFDTILKEIGGPYGFAGSTTASDCTFVFDFDQAIKALGTNWESKEFFIDVYDKNNNAYPTTVKTINFAKDGTVIKSYTPNYSLNGAKRRWSTSEAKTFDFSPTGIVLTPSSSTITPTGERQISVTVYPYDAIDKSVTWSSSNNEVAYIRSSDNYRCTLVAKSKGTVTVTATTVNGLTASCEITVQDMTLTLDRSTATIAPGDVFWLGAIITPTDYNHVELSFSDPAVVEIYDDGGEGYFNGSYLQGVDIGTTTVTAWPSGNEQYSATCEITVTDSVTYATNLTLNPSQATIPVGGALQITPVVAPADTTEQSIAWRSWTPSVATVDSTGVVTGVGAGTAYIYAETINGIGETCQVIVTAASQSTLDSVSVTTLPTKTAYTVGESLNLAGMAVTATYSDGGTSAVTGYTTNPANGAVLGTAGTQTVTVSYTEGGVTKTNSFTVSVSALTNAETPVITAQPTDKTINQNGTATLSVTASVSKGTLTYQWYSNTSKTNTGGTAVSGATSASYNAPTSATGTKYYYCVITNTDNTATGNKTASANSNAVSVTVNALTNAQTPVITAQPTDKTVDQNGTATLSVTASVSKGTLSYQWYTNTSKTNTGGTTVSGATSASYNAPTSATGTKYYYCVITNTDNTATGNKTASVNSNAVSVTVNTLTDNPEPESVVIDIGGGNVGHGDADLWLYGGAGFYGPLVATVYPAGAVQDVYWESDNPDAISVDEDGVLEVFNVFVYANITARSKVNGEVFATILVFSDSPQEQRAPH